MTPDIWSWNWWSGGLWPYLAIIIFGFLPSEFWRAISAFISHGIDERSEILEWVRAVSTALLAAVVANILIAPAGALATVPGAARVAALLLGLGVFFLFRKSVITGVFTAVAAVALAAHWFRP